jgi:hypothetical protein
MHQLPSYQEGCGGSYNTLSTIVILISLVRSLLKKKPGFGMLANSHTGLVNAENTGSTTKLWSYVNDDDDDDNDNSTRSRIPKEQQDDDDDDATRQRSRIPPSTGAYSHLQGLSFIARENLEPGHEIFVEYGDHVCNKMSAITVVERYFCCLYNIVSL